MNPRLRRESLMAMAGVLAQGGFRVALTIVIGRFGGAVVLGQASGLLSGAQFLTLLGPTSLSATLTRHVATLSSDSAHRHMQAGVIRHVRRRMIQFAMAILVAIPLVWGVLLDRQPTELVLLASLTLGLAGYGLTKAHLLGFRRIARSSVLEILTAALGLLAAVALGKIGIRDANLLWPAALAAFVFAGLAWQRAPEPSLLDKKMRQELDRFAVLGVMGTLVSAGFMYGSVIVSSEVVGGEDAGHYAAALALATPLTVVTTSIGLVLFPEFARVHHDPSKTRILLTRVVRMFAITVAPIVWLLMFFAVGIPVLVWGSDFAESSILLPALLGAMLMNGIGMPGSQALTASGVAGMGDSVRIGVAGLVTGLGVWLVGIPSMGVFAITIGYTIGTFITSAVPLLVVSRRLSIPWVLPLVRGWGFTALNIILATYFELSDSPITTRVIFAFAILTVWLLVSWRDLRGVARR